ncbi:MAG: hypothetical protein U1G07_09345 [Verrucomicrobiota bacterium]
MFESVNRRLDLLPGSSSLVDDHVSADRVRKIKAVTENSFAANRNAINLSMQSENSRELNRQRPEGMAGRGRQQDSAGSDLAWPMPVEQEGGG